MQSARTIVLFPGALGDVVLLAPTISALARRARVEISVQRTVRPVATRLLPATFGPPIDGADMSGLFGAGPLPPTLATWLAGADVVHAWLGRERVALRARLAAATGGRVSLHAVHRDDGPEHAGQAYAADVGAPGPFPAPRLALPAADAESQGWTSPSARRLVIHPGAGATAKRWPTRAFVALADAWRARGGEVAVLIGPAERDLLPAWRSTAHRTIADGDLDAALALLASAPRYVGNDSGISHVAGALGRAGVVLFGPTNSVRWRPRGGDLRPVDFSTQVGEILRILTSATPAGCLDTPPNRH